MIAQGCFATRPYRWDPVVLPDDEWQYAVSPDEPLGSKEKRWATHGDPSTTNTWLLKYARMRAPDAPSGEYWAECVVHALACLLGVPSACVRPATDSGRPAILSCSVLRSGERLEHGSELLSRLLNDRYDASAGDDNPDYTVANVQRCLEAVEGPDQTTTGRSAFDVWAGYAMLDAWVAGTDRHHDNWAVATDQSGHRRLAPSFDHGSALGFALPPAEVDLLTDPGRLRAWAEHGRSHFAGRPTMVEVARQGLRLASPAASGYWLARLADVHMGDMIDILGAIPACVLSVPHRKVVLGILEMNRRRITDACLD